MSSPKATVKMLRNPAISVGCPLFEGQTGEIDLAMAESLELAGLAEIVARPKLLKAVPETAGILGVEDEPKPAAAVAAKKTR